MQGKDVDFIIIDEAERVCHGTSHLAVSTPYGRSLFYDLYVQQQEINAKWQTCLMQLWRDHLLKACPELAAVEKEIGDIRVQWQGRPINLNADTRS